MKAKTDTRTHVSLSEGRSYDISIGVGLLTRIGMEIANFPRCRDAFVVTDENVGSLYQERLETGFSKGPFSDIHVVAIPPGEGSKTVHRWIELQDELIAFSASGRRQVFVVAFGGGVVGDLAGFLAATFRRGVPFIQIPTTLVAMVDAAIGGKTGVDHPRAKNMIGAFHQPLAVLMDPSVLRTLEERDLKCGFAEVIKTAWIRDAELAAWIEKEANGLKSRNIKRLTHIVERCAAIKAEYVEKDEFDRTGIRAHLNFGHTIGHAIEAATAYGDLYRHGEAVSVGMVCAAEIGRRLGMVHDDYLERLTGVLRRFGLPTRVTGANEKDILAAMRLDKKNIHGAHRFVLPRSVGEVEVVDDIEDGVILEVVRSRMKS
jgi:3-dehydroquinate synthase